MRVIVFCTVLCLVGSALADTDLGSVFRELERTTDSGEERSVEAAKARLTEAHAYWWEEALPPGGLRGALAASLSREDVAVLLRRAGRQADRRVERQAALAENLASRVDLVDVLLEEGVFRPLIPKHRRLLFDLSAAALVQGEALPALTMLRNPATATKTAEDLSAMAWPAGLRMLADVVVRKHSIPAEALAQLALAEPDVRKVHHERPLGSARIAALLNVAQISPDPALRAVAARVLLRAGTKDAFDAAVDAYRGARSVRLDCAEWWCVGRVHQRLVTHRLVSRRGRIEALRGTLQFAGLSPSNDPEDAEASAQALRAWLASIEDPLMYGMVIRELEHLRYHYVDAQPRRKLGVPSYVAMLRDLVKGRAEDPQALRDLGRRVGQRLLADLAREPAPHWRRAEPPPKRRVLLPELLRSLDALGVARLLAGADSKGGRRAVLADHAGDVFDTAPGKRFAKAAHEGLRLEPALLKSLIRVVAHDPDPHLVSLAGRILDLSQSAMAYEALLEHASRLWDAEVDTLPIPDLERHLRSLRDLDTTLAFIGDASQSPWIRARLAEALFDLEWMTSLSQDAHRAAFERLAAWIRESAPKLDAGLPEEVLSAWADVALHEVGESRAVFVANTLRTAIEGVLAAGPRLRLRAALLKED